MEALEGLSACTKYAVLPTGAEPRRSFLSRPSLLFAAEWRRVLVTGHGRRKVLTTPGHEELIASRDAAARRDLSSWQQQQTGRKKESVY